MVEMGRNPIFVFGSNLSGVHGAGAAAYARKHCGAVLGVGEGLTGNSYALPTKGLAPQLPTRPLADVQESVAGFISCALSNPDLTFRITAVGCGLAGFKNEQIAPLFETAPQNCIMPPEWSGFIQLQHFRFWRYEDYAL